MNREKRIANTLLAAFSAVSLALLLLPMSSPVRRDIPSGLRKDTSRHRSGSSTIVRSAPTRRRHLILADVENNELREELRNQSILRGRLVELQRENDRLRAELGMKPAAGQILLWARVMERDPLNWHRFLMVDAGEKEGLEVNAPVLGLQGETLGAVGRVSEVGPHWSKVLLLTDEQSSLAAYIPDRQWEGLVEGVGGARLRMNYLPSEAQFAIGETVRTSATSATFPPDMLVGTISKVYARDPFLTFQSVEVMPAVQPGLLKEVLVLVRQKNS